MRFNLKEFIINIDESVIIAIILSILVVPIGEYLANYFMCYLFIVFHELSHMLVASIFGVHTKRLNIKLSGLNIEIDQKKDKGIKWFLIFLAGPLSNLVLSIMFYKIQMVCIINTALMLINIMPIYPLDGYNILDSLFYKLDLKTKNKLLKNIELITFAILSTLGIMQLVFYKNVSLILMDIYIYLQSKSYEKKHNSDLYQKYYKNITKN